MDPEHPATITIDASALLRPYVNGASGRDLRAQLIIRHPECSPEEIEDAVQAACRHFLDEAEDISDRAGALFNPPIFSVYGETCSSLERSWVLQTHSSWPQSRRS